MCNAINYTILPIIVDGVSPPLSHPPFPSSHHCFGYSLAVRKPNRITYGARSKLAGGAVCGLMIDLPCVWVWMLAPTRCCEGVAKGELGRRSNRVKCKRQTVKENTSNILKLLFLH